MSSIVDLVAGWIKEQREARGLSLEDLAFELRTIRHPVSVNKLWRTEKGSERIKRIDAELVLSLERVFGCSSPMSPDSIPVSEIELWIQQLAEADVDICKVEPTSEALKRIWARTRPS